MELRKFFTPLIIYFVSLCGIIYSLINPPTPGVAGQYTQPPPGVVMTS